MEEQSNKTCFVPRDFAVERIEESFLRIRKLGVCLIIYLILALLVTLFPLLAFVIEEAVIPAFILVLFVYFIFSIIPITLLIFIVLRLTDVDWALSKRDCGDIYDFAIYLRSLRNLAVVCSIFWFALPILGIILGFILRRRMKDIRDMWMARFNPKPPLESEEPKE